MFNFFLDRRSLSCPSLDGDPMNNPIDYNPRTSDEATSTTAATSTTTSRTRTKILVSQASISNGDVVGSKEFQPKFYSPDLLFVPSRKKCDCRTFHRVAVPRTRSNLEIDDDIMEEEEEMYMNERNLEHRRLSTSLPFGLNLIERPPLETTV